MNHFLKKIVIAGALTAVAASAANLPTAKEVQAKMGMGFNIGNSMEVPNNPTAWGNPYPRRHCSTP